MTILMLLNESYALLI